MKLYVIRHGESETNRANCWTGWLDVLLTDKGREDAARAGAVIGDVKFDKIFSSDLVRASETAEIALGITDYEKDPLLREINLGSISGEKIEKFSMEERRAFWKKGYSELGGETNSQFRKRISAFFKKVEKLDCENIAAFSHSGWLRGALAMVLDAPAAREKVICKNCAIGVFEYKGGKWRLYSWINI